MCAINGITTYAPEVVARMNTATKHRGPDGTSVFTCDGITLGHNRLAIIDLSQLGAQPMQSADGRYTITFNGEIYNYKELKEELSSQYQFKTESDTEVLLAAYTKWGEDMFPRLRGIFAFGLWDSKDKSLLLVRDHMGVKPLFYTIERGVLSFSSEISGLLVGKEKATLDMKSIAFYMSMQYVPGPQTLAEGVKKLRPGLALRFRQGNAEVISYVKRTEGREHVSDSELYDTIKMAINRQLISDRPIGAYLSGGFDSSIVLHHMAEHSKHVRTYSANFEPVKGQEDDSSKFNQDAILAKRTSAFYGAEHTTFTMTISDIRDTLEEACASVSEPIANATAVTQRLLSKRVHDDGVVVVLGGDGGDELFGGYPRHRIFMGAYLFQKLPKFAQALAGSIHTRTGKLSTEFFTPLHMALEVNDEKNFMSTLMHPIPSSTIVSEYFTELYKKIPKERRHPLDIFMEVDRQTWLSDECFIRSDYAAMAHGVELRVPLVDVDVVRAADNISVWRKTLPHEGKRVLRKTYRNHLPEYLYNEPKRGWLSPAAKWFRDPMISAFVREVYSSSYYNGLDELFNWEEVQIMLDSHIEKRGYHLYPLWNILLLQIWARRHKIRVA